MHRREEGVLVQEMRGEEVMKVGCDGGQYVCGIYIVYI